MSRSRDILGLAAVLSCCSLVYEMVIAACFVSFTGDAAFWQSVTLGIYLAAVGAGSYACGRLDSRDPWLSLWRVELALFAAGALSAAGILSIETAYNVRLHFRANSAHSPALALGAAVLAQGFTVVIGFLSGFELPLLLRLARERRPGSDAAPAVLGANYLGALSGSLAFSFFLLPRLGVTGTAAAASVLNLGVSAWLLRRGAAPATPTRRAWVAAGAAAWALGLAAAPALERLNTLSYYARQLGIPARAAPASCCAPARTDSSGALAALWSRRHAVERLPSRYQRIDVLTTEDALTPLQAFFNRRPAAEPGLPYGVSLYLDRRYQFFGGAEAIYHEFLAHVPVQLFGRTPADVLILGGGDGLLAKELLKYGDRVRSITNVEIDPAMIALARRDRRLRLLNASAYHDPKVRIVVDDAFFFVRNDRARYDAVYIDLPHPYNFDVGKLYSVEFLRHVARLLKPGGFGVMDYPLTPERPGEEADEEGLRRNSIIVNTLRRAGFRAVVPYGTESPELLPVYLADRLRKPAPDLDPDPEAARLLRRVDALRFLRRHPGAPGDLKEDLILVDNKPWRETMLAFAPQPARPDFSFKEPGFPLYALNASRLRVLEGGRYPYADDPRLVNSVLRPTLFKSVHLE